MCKFKFRFLASILTFGIGIFSASLVITSLTVNKTTTENLQGLNNFTNQEQSHVNQTLLEVNDEIANWQVPIPAKKKPISVQFIDRKAVNGKSVKVTVTGYSWTGNFLTDQPTKSIHYNKMFGLCIIRDIFELKVKDRIFGYSYVAKRTKFDQETGKLIGFGMGFANNYIDSDGDGRFESITPDMDTRVPFWAIR